MAAANRNNQLSLHRIFYERHSFTNPLVNPRVLVDLSFVSTALNHGQRAPIYLTRLLGQSRLCTTRCISDWIQFRLGEQGSLPQETKILRCLHSASLNNHEACLKHHLQSVNPKEYILATVDYVHLANTVQGLPIITMTEAQPAAAVFRQPSASQILYADRTTDAKILSEKHSDLKTLKNRKRSVKKKSRLRGSR